MNNIVQPPTNTSTPEDIVRLRLALNRLYWRAIELGQLAEQEGSQERARTEGNEEPLDSCQDAQDFDDEVCQSYGSFLIGGHNV